MKNIPIFFTFNNNYTVPAAVAFYSLLNKAKDDIFYEMYVLHSDVSEENQKLLKEIVSRFKNAELTFKNTGGFMDEFWSQGNFEGHNTRTQFTADAIVRCFGARFFPQYDKIIYSDVDIVVADDISEVYDIDLEGKYLAGVKNVFMKYAQSELSHLKPEHYDMLKDSYIGGGIWVMNLKKIREDNLEQKMIDVIKDDTIVKRWNDQDIVNISCENKVAYIPLNYISYPYLDDLLQNENFVSHYSNEEMYDSIINPKIIHYAAAKPWQYTAKKAEVWWEIFHYLKLPKTEIFQDANSSHFNIYQKKYKKYKKLFNIFLIINIVIVCILLVMIFGMLLL